MMRVFFLMIGLAICFASQCSADEDDSFNPKNYMYDYEWNALFIKVYVQNHQDDPWQQYHKHSPVSDDEQIYHLLIQEDQKGSFIAVPIKKKKKDKEEEDDDKDESDWECPYCGTINPSYRNCCSNPKCVLYRKNNRNWYTALENHELSADIIN